MILDPINTTFAPLPTVRSLLLAKMDDSKRQPPKNIRKTAFSGTPNQPSQRPQLASEEESKWPSAPRGQKKSGRRAPPLVNFEPIDSPEDDGTKDILCQLRDLELRRKKHGEEQQEKGNCDGRI